jgi:hypothetical protein
MNVARFPKAQSQPQNRQDAERQGKNQSWGYPVWQKAGMPIEIVLPTEYLYPFIRAPGQCLAAFGVYEYERQYEQ